MSEAVKNLLPSSLPQNPSPFIVEGQQYQITLQEQVDRVLAVFRQLVPSNYVAQVPGPWYTTQYQVMAEQIANFQITAQEVFADTFNQFTRAEVIYQILGNLIFPDAQDTGYPAIEGDLTYRAFLIQMVNLLLQGSTAVTMQGGVEALTDATVQVIERGVEARLLNGTSAWGIDDKYVFEVNISNPEPVVLTLVNTISPGDQIQIGTAILTATTNLPTDGFFQIGSSLVSTASYIGFAFSQASALQGVATAVAAGPTLTITAASGVSGNILPISVTTAVAGAMTLSAPFVTTYNFADDPATLQQNVALVLRALKPAHTLYELRNLFVETFGDAFTDSSLNVATSDNYQDMRQFWYGAQALSGTQGIVSADRTRLSDPTRDFSNISPGAELTLVSGTNPPGIYAYPVSEVFTFLQDDPVPRAYTTSPTGITGTGTVSGSNLSDPNQTAWHTAVDGETLTLLAGPNKGTYRIKYVLGPFGGVPGSPLLAPGDTGFQVAPCVLQLRQRIGVYPAWSPTTTYAQNSIVSYNGQNYTSLLNGNFNQIPTPSSYWSLGLSYDVTVDRLGVQQVNQVIDEDESSQFVTTIGTPGDLLVHEPIYSGSGRIVFDGTSVPQAHSIQIQILTSGGLGVGTMAVLVDGATVANNVSIPSAPYTIPTTTLVLDFSVVTGDQFNSGTVYSAAINSTVIRTTFGPLCKNWGDGTPATIADVVVNVDGSPVAVSSVNPYTGQITLTTPVTIPPSSTVTASYYWQLFPYETMLLNTPGLTLGQWNMPIGSYDSTTIPSQVGSTECSVYSYNVVLGPPERLFPVAVGQRFIGFQKAYSALLNSPTTLLLNQDPTKSEVNDFSEPTPGETAAFNGGLVTTGTLTFTGQLSQQVSLDTSLLVNANYEVFYTTPDNTPITTLNVTTSGFTANVGISYGSTRFPKIVTYTIAATNPSSINPVWTLNGVDAGAGNQNGTYTLIDNQGYIANGTLTFTGQTSQTIPLPPGLIPNANYTVTYEPPDGSPITTTNTTSTSFTADVGWAYGTSFAPILVPYSVVYGSGDPTPTSSNVAVWYRETDLTFPSTVYAVARLQVPAYPNINGILTPATTPDGIFTGIGFGLHDNNRLYFAGLLLLPVPNNPDQPMQCVGLLQDATQSQDVNGWTVGPSIAGTIQTDQQTVIVTTAGLPTGITPGSRFTILSGTQTGFYTVASIIADQVAETTAIVITGNFPAPANIYGNSAVTLIFEVPWSVNIVNNEINFSTYRLQFTPSQASTSLESDTFTLSISGAVSATITGSPAPVPPPADNPLAISTAFKSQVFFGSIYPWATSQTIWQFMRYGIQSDQTAIRGYSVSVLNPFNQTGSVLPEDNTTNTWFLTDPFGWSDILPSNDGMILQGALSPNLFNAQFGYERIEGFLGPGAILDLDTAFQVNSGQAQIVIQDTQREVLLNTLLYYQSASGEPLYNIMTDLNDDPGFSSIVTVSITQDLLSGNGQLKILANTTGTNIGLRIAPLAWVSTTTYSNLQVVVYLRRYYRSSQNGNIGHHPSTSPLFWVALEEQIIQPPNNAIPGLNFTGNSAPGKAIYGTDIIAPSLVTTSQANPVSVANIIGKTLVIEYSNNNGVTWTPYFYTFNDYHFRQLVTLPSVGFTGVYQPQLQGWTASPGSNGSCRTQNNDLVMDIVPGSLISYQTTLDATAVPFIDDGSRRAGVRFAVETPVLVDPGVGFILESPDYEVHFDLQLAGPAVRLKNRFGATVTTFPFVWTDLQQHSYVLVVSAGNVSVLADGVLLGTHATSSFSVSFQENAVIFGTAAFISATTATVRWREAFASIIVPSAINNVTALRTLGVWLGGDQTDLNNWEIPRTDTSTADNTAQVGPVIETMDWTTAIQVRVFLTDEWGVTVLRPNIALPPYYHPQSPFPPTSPGYTSPSVEPSAGWINVEYPRLPGSITPFGSIAFGALTPQGSTEQIWNQIQYTITKTPIQDMRSPRLMLLNQYNVVSSGDLLNDINLQTEVLPVIGANEISLLSGNIFAASIYKIIDGQTIFTSLDWTFYPSSQSVTLNQGLTFTNPTVTVMFAPGNPVTTTYLQDVDVQDSAILLNENTPLFETSRTDPASWQNPVPRMEWKDQLLNHIGTGLAQVTFFPSSSNVQLSNTPWSSVPTYTVNQTATFNGLYYASLQNGNQGNEPDTSPTWWALIQPKISVENILATVTITLGGAVGTAHAIITFANQENAPPTGNPAPFPPVTLSPIPASYTHPLSGIVLSFNSVPGVFVINDTYTSTGGVLIFSDDAESLYDGMDFIEVMDGGEENLISTVTDADSVVIEYGVDGGHLVVVYATGILAMLNYPS